MTPSTSRSRCSPTSRRRAATRSRCSTAATPARPSTRRSCPRATRRAMCSSASTTPCSPAAWRKGIFSPVPAKGLDSVPAALQLDKGEHRVTPARLRRHLRQLRPRLLRQAQDRAAEDLRRPGQARSTRTCSSRRTPRPPPRASPSSSAPSRSTAPTAGRATGRSSRPTASRSSTAGSRPTTSGSPAPRPPRARATSRWWSLTPPARPPRCSARSPRPSRRPTGVATGTCFRQIEFGGLLKGAPNEKGGKALLDFLLSKKFQEDVPLQMYRQPGPQGRQGAGAVHEVRHDDRQAGDARPGDDHQEPRTVDQAVVLARSEVARARRGKPTPGNGGAARPDGPAARLLRAVLRLPGRRDRRAGAEGRRAVAARPDRRGARRPGRAPRPVVHRLAGGGLDRADAADRAARRVCLRPLRLPRQAAAAGAW